MHVIKDSVAYRYCALYRSAVLVLTLSTTALWSALAVADKTPPTAPGGLTGIRYSSTAGEILWQAATDDVSVIGYRVIRNGDELGIKDARSLFEPGLEPGQAYTYRVSAVDRAGNTGPELIVQIAATVGATRQGGSTDSPTNNTTDSPADGTEGSADNTGGSTGDKTGSHGGYIDGGLVLYTSHSRITLVEGDSTGFSINLSLDRIKQDKREVSLSLESDAGRDMLGLRHTFSSDTLPPDQSGSVLTLQLDITVAPLLLHERYFQIVADDGESRTDTALVIDITPTAAPDVYLLIGQSNMEGYSEVGSRDSLPGGKDERVDRIRQLNVQPNNAAIFSSSEAFTDEMANVRNPGFVIAEDPLHEPRYIEVDGKGASFVGLGLTFAKETLRTTTADIYLVPAAWGATGFCANANGELAWNATTTDKPFLGGTLLADRALTRLNMTLRETGGILRGILWHQGGADSNNLDCAAAYGDNLARLAARLRAESRLDGRGSNARREDADIPFIVATQSKGDDERGRFSLFSASKQLVDSAQRDVRDYIAYSGFVNNDDLVPPHYPCGQVSCVHFGADALREQGRRFYAGLKGIWSELGAYHY